MATIGSIKIAFEADIQQLEAGIDRVLQRFDELKKSVGDFSSQLDSVSESTVAVSVEADTTEVKKAAKEVEELGKDIEAESPVVRIRATGSIGKQFFQEAKAQAKEYGDSLVELSKEAGKAVKTSASAATAIGSVLDGTSTSLSGLIVAAGRAEKAVLGWKAAIASAAVAAGAFVQYSGGMRTVSLALGGSVAANARLLAAMGAAAGGAAASVATFAGLMAVARVAASGLSEEAQSTVARWSALGAAAAAAGVGIRASGISFAIVYKSLSESSTAAEFFANAMRNATASASSFAVSASQYITGFLNVLILARVASGEFRQSLGRIGAEAESIAKMADRFGATVEQMLILDYAARAASVGMSQLARASQAFFTNVSKVKIGQLGTAEAQEAKFAFDRLGVSIEDLRNKSPQQVFALVADRLVSVKDASDRAAIAFDLFGRQAVNILPALKGLKDAEADSRRLGTTLSGLNFKAFENVDNAFDRASESAANFTEAMLSGFLPIQTGAANVFADLVGGAASALAPIRALAAAFTIPFQQFLEVAARVVNIILRLAGAAASVVTAFFDAPALAGPWTVLGDAIKDVLVPIEAFVSAVEDTARALFSELNPALAEGASVAEKALYVLQGFVTVVALGGIFNAVGQSFNVSLIRALQRGWAVIAGLNWSTAFGYLRTAMRVVLIDSVNAAQTFVGNWIAAGIRMMTGFVQPFISQVAVILTGNAAIATSAIVTNTAIAAAWVIGTLGVAALIVAIIAVIQNFDRLYDYFANFGENAAKLFTLDGLAEAGQAVADAIIAAFKSAFNYVSSFFGNLVQNIVVRVRGIPTPEKIDAAKANVQDVIQSRRGQQMASVQARMAIADMGFGTVPKPPTDDYDALAGSLERSRGDMIGLSFEAAKFGEVGSKAFLAAKADFAKLQQDLANDKLVGQDIVDENGIKRSETALETFERRYKEIQDRLKENIGLADAISPEQLQKSAEEMIKTVEDVMSDVRKVSRGRDLGSTFSVDRFFPTSDAIKDRAVEFARSYENELKGIEEALQRGDYGSGQEALKMAAREREKAKDKFDRNRAKIDADVSFASEIRKSLEEAFLSPLDKYEKKLKEIADNQSLTDAEKARATAMEQKQMVEGTFGKTAGQSLRDKEDLLGKAERSGAFLTTEGSPSAAAARASAERTKMAIEQRKAAGLDATPVQQLKAGLDSINDAFGVTGLSMQEIQAKFAGTPGKLAEYEEAVRANRDAVLKSVGVEKSAVQVREEARRKLQGLALSASEASQANRAIADSFMSALGITKTPFEQFSGELDNIATQFGMAGEPLSKVRESLKGNANDLALFDRAVKQARDNLLASLGVEKSPQQVFEEQMKKIDEAVNASDPEKRISGDEASRARIAAARKRDEALGADTANSRAAKFAEQRAKIEEAYGKDGQKNVEAFNAAMRNLRKQAPGAEPESPVAKFEDQLRELQYMMGSGALSPQEFSQQKLNLQAQLQEDLKPALDSTKADRRGVEGADVRSKAGVDTFFRILRGNDNPSLKAQLEIARNTRVLAEASRNPDAAPVIAQLSVR
jgi:hypothetical protein